jgi:hypothetical protein
MQKKDNLLVSFSGGETSAFLAWWLWNNKRDVYNMVFVFANTGDEEEETYKFIHQCEIEFGFKIHWVEALVSEIKGVGTKHQLKTFDSASRNREPYVDVIKKYGIPNQNFPHCNREMKLSPIKSFAKEYFNGEKYFTAIGIRCDEFDRISKDHKKNRIIYPLITDIRMDKARISKWWSDQSFRVNLPSYKTNCRTCWKKSTNILCKIYNDNPEYFNFNLEMEEKYGGGKYVFFRKGLSTIDLIELAKKNKGYAKDKHSEINYQTDLFESESCDIYSNCGE